MKTFFVRKISLRAKLIIPFVGIAVLPLLLVTFITIQNLQAVQREQTNDLSRLAAQEAAEEISAFISLHLEVLKNIGTVHPEFAGDPVIRDILLERFLHRSGAFLDIALIDQNGRQVVRKNLVEVITPENLIDVSGTEEFQRVLQDGSYVGPFLLSRGRPVFVLAREIRGVGGDFQGAIIAQVDARTLQDVVTKLLLQEENIHTYIVNQEGRVIAHPDISEVLAERNFSFLALIQEFMSNQAATEITQTYENETGETVLGTGILFNANKELSMAERWLIIVEQPATVALAPVREITQFSLLVLGLALIISFAGAILIANSFSRPIRELQKGAVQIGLGNLDYSFRVHTNDELQDLASEFNKMRLRLKEIRAREENLSKLKSEFVSIVAHQLRTPLSALKWGLALLDESKPRLKKEQTELLLKMTVSNERMIRLVNDLLDVARIEEGRFVYKKTEIDVHAIIKNVLDATKIARDQKQITVIVEKQKLLLPQIFVDKDALTLAVQNLVENAIQYTPQYGTLEIHATRVNNTVQVSLRDSGIGIAKEDQSRIFSKFFRGAQAVRLETEGSGLGLFIVKNIIEAHGGKIWFDSEQGKGTTFYFTIPVSYT